MTTSNYRAVALLYPDALATSITLPMEILHAAAQRARSGGRHTPGCNFHLAGAAGSGQVRLGTGLTLSASAGLGALPPPDLLLLPAVWRSPRRTRRLCEPLHGELRRLAAAGTRLCSVGTASRVLADAGLLDGRSATTHWSDFDRFAADYPTVTLRRRHLITQSGNLYCAGSVNSIADLLVHIVEQWYGPAVARAVESQFSPESRQTFMSAAFLEDSRTSHADERVLDAQLYLQENLAERHSLSALARRAGLAPRSFGRRFRRATGTTPMAYLLQLRVGEARSLLLHSDLPLGEVAWRCGWQSASRFSEQFRARTGLAPREYRAATRGKRFQAQLP
ncbi:GlxA family transcriptional regulator [Pseudohaliea rubra]|uniref:Transcriptional regulator, AraC family n=1 Tax=Pseudohaliea rubra DSM 19751 TaxID=1265313 RepID=A0A095XZF3_9GAMM|nr:helix-turn-helix domain-containing protein [Pseudohaliea rubra]KGE05131.1 Transcriptional regulator, AraC family [Pseudohaliea rubra DSM 19751]